MSILDYRPKELAAQRKITSDAKNNTESLTFEDSKDSNKRAAAYKGVREYMDKKDLRLRLNAIDYDEDYYNNLLGDEWMIKL